METSMEEKIVLDAIYAPSEDVVAREIEGELIIVPLVAGIGEPAPVSSPPRSTSGAC
jgi:hypothetical protein